MRGFDRQAVPMRDASGLVLHHEGGGNRSDRRGFIPEDLYIQVGAR